MIFLPEKGIGRSQNMYNFTRGSLSAVKTLLLSVLILVIFPAAAKTSRADNSPPNIIFILVDDQRYDALGMLDSRLSTPNLDRLAAEGVFFVNATVTTSLCSPSRASILTSQYTHDHGVVDNNVPLKKGTVTFPEVLQKSGYQTALVGKWHMGGHSDEPRPGFDHWVSFAGQGNYLPVDKYGNSNLLNINGVQVPQKAYITDELTDYALNWLRVRDSEQPFFLYLSHKAVHSNFEPPKRHRDRYAKTAFPLPDSAGAEAAKNKPLWVQNQRNSFHGIEFAYHRRQIDLEGIQRRYYGALQAVDDSVGRIRQWIEQHGDPENTIIIFTSDNGFLFGDHGLIDKRNAYEASLRVPLIMYGSTLPSGETVTAPVINIDLAPTILELAGADSPDSFSGRSVLPVIFDKAAEWREASLYEYFWEFNYPHTPTTFSVRTPRYKLIQYHGIWDTDELYDLEKDPDEQHNLIESKEHLPTVVKLRQLLYRFLANRDGEHVVPYSYKYNSGAVFRSKLGTATADHPSQWLKTGNEKDLRDFKITDEEKMRVKDEQALDALRRKR